MALDKAKITIVNIDDNEAPRYVRTRILREHGYRVIEGATGQEALNVVASEHPDLVLLDVHLPDINGIEVCRRIKERASVSVLVLQISATSIHAADRVRALELGADGYLIEPVEPEELLATVNALLRLHKAEQDLRTALEQKDVLLRELNHRVKNNLQIVASLLSVQASQLTDSMIKQEFQKARQRIATIAKIHDRLYKSADIRDLDFGAHLRELCSDLSASLVDEPTRVSLVVEAEDHRLGLDHVIPLGLIVNELIANALKHAFPPPSAGTIRVSFAAASAGQYALRVADDGCGLPTGFDPMTEGGLGMRLLKAIVGQIDGTMTFAGSSGFAVEIIFPALSKT